MRERWRAIGSFCLLGLLLAGLFLLNLVLGSSDFTPKEAIDALFGGGKSDVILRILWEMRLPRAIAAAVLGAALSTAGLLLQTFFANPIAGPFVLGISSGAKLTVAFAMVLMVEQGFLLSSAGLILAAFLGALAAMGLVLICSMKVRQMSGLVVCGVMIGYICSAVTDLMVTFAQDSHIVNLHNWSVGGFSGIWWGNVQVILAVVLPGLLGAFLLAKPMSAYQLGASYAQSVGVDLKRFRTLLVLLSSLLSACVAAFAGPISFVGIAVPHVVRRLMGTARPILILPACMLGGAVFCLFCDLLARLLAAPAELALSSVTAVFGAPVVIGILINRRRGEGR